MADRFWVEFASHVQKDLSKLPREIRDVILKRAKIVEQNPFPHGNINKKIKGMKYPLFRLRVNTAVDSFRLFYGIHQQTALILRIVSKKEIDRVLKLFRQSG